MEIGLVGALAVAVVAAFAGGLLARRLGLPVILGYLAAGVALGPFTPGPVAEAGTIAGLAEVGVAFLMFALGAELARSELRELGRTALIAGSAQIAAVSALGAMLGAGLGYGWAQALFLGALLSLSSTVVALKVLEGRGQAGSLHARAALALLVAQDLAVVPMVILLPTLGGAPEGFLPVADHVLRAAAVVAVAFFVGTRVVPWLLGHAAGRHTRELFLVGVVALALGTAAATGWLGLSAAFGAFVAGVVLAGSEYRTQVLAEVLPLRDLFVSLFFVSIGTLVDPSRVLAHPLELTAVLAAVTLAKPLLAAGALGLAGTPVRTALLGGAAVGQMGEFSFVLARVGVDAGAIPASVFELILAGAVASIVVAPAVLASAEWSVGRLERSPLLARAVDAGGDRAGETELRRHVVICGHGRVAAELMGALERRGFRYVVVDYDPGVIRSLRAAGVPAIYGDAANPKVLEHAGVDRAALVAVLVPDPVTAEAATRYARSRGPLIDVIARARDAADVERLRSAGANDVIQPEFEAGMELIRHALRRFGVTGTEVQTIAAGRRAAFYRRDG